MCSEMTSFRTQEIRAGSNFSVFAKLSLLVGTSIRMSAALLMPRLFMYHIFTKNVLVRTALTAISS